MVKKTYKIPFFNYPALYENHKDEYEKAILEVLGRGAYIMQQDLFDFERNLENYLGVKHAIGVADGTMALTMALRAASLPLGSEVIVPSHTFVASAASIHHAGLKPILVDCREDHLIDPNVIEKAISSKTKAIMPVQLNGRTANMDMIMQIASENNLVVIEDSCQALGSKFKGKFAGTFGLAGTFSFFPAKTLGCFGDGGALVTNSDVVAKIVKELRDHGRSENGKISLWGYNARLDNVQAAILNIKLQYYNSDITRRREIASIYHRELSEISQLHLPPPPDNGEHFDIFQNYEIEADNREKLREFLDNRNISTILQWGGQTIHQFEELGLNSDLPFTENMTKKFMLLPLNTSLSDEEVYYICSSIMAFYS